MARANKPKHPNRVYSTKASAERASKRYGGRGIKKISIMRYGGRNLEGWGIRW
jgi:hypothetical protein